MGVIVFEILLIAVLILLNGIFSMSELAVVSSRRVRLERQAERGSRGARAAIELAENPRKFLSTVQIGITLVGILAGAFGGATIVQVLGSHLSEWPVVGLYAETIAFVLVVAVITYFSIVIGELIPKSVALNSPETIATAVSRPMKLVSSLAAPFVWLLSVPTSFILKLFGVHASVEPPVTDEEIKDLIEAGTRAGVFEESEQDMIESIIELEAQRVTSLMTPRTEIEWIDVDAPADEIRQELAETRFSRLPIGRGTLDNILGYVTAKVVLRNVLKSGSLDIGPALQKPQYIPESQTILDLLEHFRGSITHLAVVVNEHGGVEGIVTMHDIMEALVGELANNPHTLRDEKIQKLEDGSLVVDGRLPIPDFKEALGIEEMPNEDRGTYETVAGFVLARLGRLPKSGDQFSWSNYVFKVASMDGNRVEKIQVACLNQDTQVEAAKMTRQK